MAWILDGRRILVGNTGPAARRERRSCRRSTDRPAGAAWTVWAAPDAWGALGTFRPLPRRSYAPFCAGRPAALDSYQIAATDRMLADISRSREQELYVVGCSYPWCADGRGLLRPGPGRLMTGLAKMMVVWCARGIRTDRPTTREDVS
jgi:hypothetical protein